VPAIDPRPFRSLRKRAAKGKRAPVDTHGEWASKHAMLLQKMQEMNIGAMLPQPMSEELAQLSFQLSEEVLAIVDQAEEKLMDATTATHCAAADGIAWCEEEEGMGELPEFELGDLDEDIAGMAGDVRGPLLDDGYDPETFGTT